MDQHFDDVCRLLASDMPRRRALRLILGALAGGGLASLSARRAAAWDVACPPGFGDQGRCPRLEQCCQTVGGGFCCADPTPVCCAPANRSDKCCQSLKACCTLAGGADCCPGNQECCAVGMGATLACCPPERPVCCGFGIPGLVDDLCCPTSKQCCPFPAPLGNGCCPPNQVCCPLGLVFGCCLPFFVCCPPGLGGPPPCCPPERPVCCPGFCCPAARPVCCPNPGGPPVCCRPGEICDNGVCTVLVYDFRGGGKFLINGAVSTLRVSLSGTADSGGTGGFSDSSDIQGGLRAFHYPSRTLIESVSFSSLEVELLGGPDFLLTSRASARVNGVLTDIEFDASSVGGTVEFEIRRVATMTFLAGGTGEAGRSGFALNTSFIPAP